MKKRLVNLLNPEMCQDCRFCSHIYLVLDVTKPPTKHVQCGRKDCDNWDTVTAKDIEINPFESPY